MSRKLKADSGFGGDSGTIRRMREQNASGLGIDRELCKHGTKMFGVRGVMVGHAQDLQTIGDNFFVLQDANSCEAQRVKIN